MQLSRRQVLKLAAAAGAAATPLRGLAQLAAAARDAGPSSGGFLTAGELSILSAAASLLLPSDEGPGAREIGVVAYVQSLLSYLPESDANCDRFVGAADVIAVTSKAAGADAGCAQGGDVNGDGVVDAADVSAAALATFAARPAFGGGPFSGRQLQPHAFPVGQTACAECHGAHPMTARAATARAATFDVYPPDAFRLFLPLNRVQRLSWKVRLLGAAAAQEVSDNPLLQTLPEVDLRERYREGLAILEASSREMNDGKGFAEISADQARKVLAQAPLRFVDLLRRHVIQGTLCAPEYGGNRDRIGWQLVGFDGDSQPLGYEIYDASAPGFYRERPDKPNSGPNPDENCAGFTPEMQRFLGLISGATGGRTFSAPFCFEVEK